MGVGLPLGARADGGVGPACFPVRALARLAVGWVERLMARYERGRTSQQEDAMLELYHSINSVCAQKVRIALAEKGLTAKEHLMTLRGDQFDPGYLKLNASGVVPTLIHDGTPVTESSVIL